jgi:hypothetical protein
MNEYLQVFNEFITSYHSSNQHEDEVIMKEWQSFKKII